MFCSIAEPNTAYGLSAVSSDESSTSSGSSSPNNPNPESAKFLGLVSAGGDEAGADDFSCGTGFRGGEGDGKGFFFPGALVTCFCGNGRAAGGGRFDGEGALPIFMTFTAPGGGPFRGEDGGGDLRGDTAPGDRVPGFGDATALGTGLALVVTCPEVFLGRGRAGGGPPGGFFGELSTL